MKEDNEKKMGEEPSSKASELAPDEARPPPTAPHAEKMSDHEYAKKVAHTGSAPAGHHHGHHHHHHNGHHHHHHHHHHHGQQHDTAKPANAATDRRKKQQQPKGRSLTDILQSFRNYRDNGGKNKKKQQHHHHAEPKKTTTAAATAAAVATPVAVATPIPPHSAVTGVEDEEEKAHRFHDNDDDDDENRESTVRFSLPGDIDPAKTTKLSTDESGAVETMALRESTVRFDVPDDKDLVSRDLKPLTATPPPSTTTTPVDMERLKHDRAYAHKLRQQMQDEALALELHKKERRKQRARNFREASARFSRNMKKGVRSVSMKNVKRYSMYAFDNAKQSIREIRELDKKNPWRVRIRRVVLTIIIGGIVIGCLFWFAVLGNDVPQPILDFLNDLTPEEYAEADPFNAKDPSEADPWETEGNGLQLEVLNALEAKWNPYFDDAIRDWDQGYPDALNLNTSVIAREINCTHISGVVKVCNGDYGETGWRGINNMIITNGFITSSTARMNEFYTGDPATDDDEMQYVMCHELGHAWGVLHTDEIFGNKDLGNCMDYTNNEENNRTPDFSNYQFMFALYGLVPGAEPYTSPPTVAPTPAPVDNSNTRRGRRVDRLSSSAEVPPPSVRRRGNNWEEDGAKISSSVKTTKRGDPLEERLQLAMDSVLDFRSGSRLQPSKWRLVHRNTHGESHEVDLLPGHTLRVHKLLA